MPSWFFSLQFRLVVGFAVILALATGGVGLFIGQAAHREVRLIQLDFDRARSVRVNETLAEYYRESGDWDGVQGLIEQAGFLSDREIVVLNEAGEVVGESGRMMDDREERRGHQRRHHHLPVETPGVAPGEGRFAPIIVGETQVGAVLVLSGGPGAAGAPGRRPGLGPGPGGRRPEGGGEWVGEPPLIRFAESISRSLVWAGLTAGATGVLLMSLFSRRILRSVRGLTAAARALGGGDLSQRVDVKGKDEVAELGHTFNAMADALQDAERQRRSLAADVAHELRTPLSNVQGYTEALRDGVLQPDAATLDTIHRQVVYLARLIDDLRLLAETEAGDFRVHPEPESLGDIIRQAAGAFGPKAAAQGVAVAAVAPEDLPAVPLDRTRIEQVIGNLVDNAIRHTPPGGTVTISAAATAATPGRGGDGEGGGGSVTVAVTDSGAGIPAEALPYVFERLYRVDPSRDRATGGTGLGLTIARKLVEAHGGTITAESVPGKGSRFAFSLPAGPGGAGSGKE